MFHEVCEGTVGLIIYGMRMEASSNHVRLAATNSLFLALRFFEYYFKRQVMILFEGTFGEEKFFLVEWTSLFEWQHSLRSRRLG